MLVSKIMNNKQYYPCRSHLSIGKLSVSLYFTLPVDVRIATISLARPKRLNAIDDYMPVEIAKCVELANVLWHKET